VEGFINCMRRSFINCMLHETLLGDRIKKDETGYAPRMGQMRNAYNILVGKPEGKRSLGSPRYRREGNWVGKCGVDAAGSGYESVAGCYEYGNEPLDSIKDGEFLDWLRDF